MIELDKTQTREEFESMRDRYRSMAELSPCCAQKQVDFIKRSHEVWKSGAIVGAILGTCTGLLLGVLLGGAV